MQTLYAESRVMESRPAWDDILGEIDEETGAAAADDLMARFGSGGNSNYGVSSSSGPPALDGAHPYMLGSPDMVTIRFSRPIVNQLVQRLQTLQRGSPKKVRSSPSSRTRSWCKRGSANSSSRLGFVSFNEDLFYPPSIELASSCDAGGSLHDHPSEPSEQQPVLAAASEADCQLQDTPVLHALNSGFLTTITNVIPESNDIQICEDDPETRHASNKAPMELTDISMMPQLIELSNQNIHPKLEGTAASPKPQTRKSKRWMGFKLLRISCLISSTRDSHA